MNPQILPFAVFAAAMMLHAPYCVGQGVFYGANSNTIDVAFVDTNLSASSKSAIAADLQTCLSGWGKQSELELRNKGESLGYLYNANRCPHYPEALDFPDNIINGTNGLALQIPKKLSDAYTNAFAFAAANSNIVAAAYALVQFVSSTNFYSVTSNQISDYVLANQAPSLLYQLSFPDITNSLRYSTCYPPRVSGTVLKL